MLHNKRALFQFGGTIAFIGWNRAEPYLLQSVFTGFISFKKIGTTKLKDLEQRFDSELILFMWYIFLLAMMFSLLV